MCTGWGHAVDFLWTRCGAWCGHTVNSLWTSCGVNPDCADGKCKAPVGKPPTAWGWITSTQRLRGLHRVVNAPKVAVSERYEEEARYCRARCLMREVSSCTW